MERENQKKGRGESFSLPAVFSSSSFKTLRNLFDTEDDYIAKNYIASLPEDISFLFFEKKKKRMRDDTEVKDEI